jgi:catalase (peroxidase I)
MYTSFVLLLLLSTCYSVTVTDERLAIAEIENFIRTTNIANPSAKLVRLAFHDCVGGCDGCINFDNPDNNGLMQTYFRINTMYNTSFNSTGMSRADFIALAGVIGIRQGSLEQDCMALSLPPDCEKPTPTLSIKYGRKDCPTSPVAIANHDFPNPHGNLTHVLTFFRDEFNMTTRQTVAIIGAHSLGAAGIQQSGFRGPWAPPTTRFNHQFYTALVSSNNMWFQEAINETQSSVFPDVRYQWSSNVTGRPQLLMLNADMALFKYIQPDMDGQEINTTCRVLNTNCPPSMTASIVEEFANNNTLFMEEFGPAFQLMIENGYRTGDLVSADNVTGATLCQHNHSSIAAIAIEILIIITLFL